MILVDKPIKSLPCGLYVHYVRLTNQTCIYFFEAFEDSVKVLTSYWATLGDPITVSRSDRARNVSRKNLTLTRQGYSFRLTDDEFMLEASELI